MLLFDGPRQYDDLACAARRWMTPPVAGFTTTLLLPVAPTFD